MFFFSLKTKLLIVTYILNLALFYLPLESVLFEKLFRMTTLQDICLQKKGQEDILEIYYSKFFEIAKVSTRHL